MYVVEDVEGFRVLRLGSTGNQKQMEPASEWAFSRNLNDCCRLSAGISILGTRAMAKACKSCNPHVKSISLPPLQAPNLARPNQPYVHSRPNEP